MEHHIEHAVNSAFRGEPETAEFLLKNLPTDRIVGLLKARLTDQYPNAKEEVSKLTAEIARLRTERNNILHWIWGKAEDPTMAVHASIRPFREDRMRYLTATDIQKIADDMLVVSRALVKWGDLLHTQYVTSQPDILKPLNETLEQLTRRRNLASPSGPGLLDMPPPSGPRREPSQE